MNATGSRTRLVVACDAARTGGRLALAMFAEREKLEVDMKGRQDRATEADRRVEQAIRGTIGSHYPDAAILGEEFGLETGAAGSDDLWVVDPIDGTDCFIFGLPMWSISIAWLRDGTIRAGAVYDPVHDEMFAASLGHGAQLNGQAIAASQASDMESGLVGIGHSTRIPPEKTLLAIDRLLARGGLFHRCGSGALSLAWVAAGRLIAYSEPHMNAWDCLAGLLLVREAGGWHNDFLARDGLTRGNPVLASGPNLIDEIRAVAGET